MVEAACRDGYRVLDELIADGPGRIALGATASDVTYLLDGVPLGPGPIELSVLGGRHRLSASKAHSDEIWGRTVSVVPGRVARVQARFDRLDDPDEANALLVRGLASGALDPELAELLSRWCTEHAVRRLRLLMAQPVAPPAPMPEGEPPGMPIYRVRQAVFDPRLREVRPGPWRP